MRHGAHLQLPMLLSTGSHMRPIQRATSWGEWRTGHLKEKMEEMDEVEGNNTTETTEVTIPPGNTKTILQAKFGL